MNDTLITLLVLGALLYGCVQGWRELTGGELNPALICRHCGARGTTRVLTVTRKTGVSGGKATGAILTGGWSLLAVGLSRKQKAQQLSCQTCNVRSDVV